MKDIGADVASITGHVTHICCNTTARRGFPCRYKVGFLRDAAGTLTVEKRAVTTSAEQLQTFILVAQEMFISEVVKNE